MLHQWLDLFIYLFFHGWHSYNTVSQIISHMCEALSGSLIVWGLLWLLFNNQILVNVCYSMFKTKCWLFLKFLFKKALFLFPFHQGMEYLHAKGIPHGSLSSKCVSLHHRVCISVTPQVQSTRNLEASELTYLPPENMRRLWVRGEEIILCQRPTFAADVFSFG